MKNKFVAAALAFFAGTFGIHRFYLGQKGLGFLYLIFFWTGIVSIIAIIDAILLFMKDEDDFNEKFNAEYMNYMYDEPIIKAEPAYNPYTKQENFDLRPVEQLERLYNLRKVGALSDLEFEFQKEKIIFR